MGPSVTSSQHKSPDRHVVLPQVDDAGWVGGTVGATVGGAVGATVGGTVGATVGGGA